MSTATTHSDRAHRLLAAKGPFASVYFDDSHDSHDAVARLAVTVRDIARELKDLGADAALVSLLEWAILNARPPVGRSGHGLIATADGVVIDEHLIIAPPSPIVRVSELPYVVPLVEFGSVSTTFIVAAVDHLGADFTAYEGATVRTKTVEGSGYPVHKSAASETHGWGDQEHRVEEAIRKNVRTVADALTEDCDRDQPELVFLVGQDRVRAEFVSALPERVRTRVVQPHVGARKTGVNDTVARAVAVELQSRRLAAASDVARRFRSEAGRQSGVAIEGLDAVCAALREDAVATLILGRLADETVLTGDDLTMVATDADELSEFGAPPRRTMRADEAIPFAAMASGAQLVFADESVNARDGVAALLRYPAVAPPLRPTS